MAAFRRYFARRVLGVVAVIFTAAVINFVLINLAPGDPAVIFQGEFGGYYSEEKVLEAIREKWGLNKPLHERLLIYLSKILQGDLGYSYLFNENVSNIIAKRLGPTLFVMFSSFALALSTGSLAGAYAARKLGTKSEHVVSTIAVVLLSLPSFWVGLILVYIFGFHLGILPTSGMVSTHGEREGIAYFLDVAQHAILPTLALYLVNFPTYFMVARASTTEVMREDFILVARAKGLSEKDVFRKHALRNAMLPVVTLAGLWLGFALTGAVLIETVFSWPGMGRLLFDSVFSRDYPVLMGIFFITSVLVATANLVTDLLYGYLDPRVTYE